MQQICAVSSEGVLFLSNFFLSFFFLFFKIILLHNLKLGLISSKLHSKLRKVNKYSREVTICREVTSKAHTSISPSCLWYWLISVCITIPIVVHWLSGHREILSTAHPGIPLSLPRPGRKSGISTIPIPSTHFRSLIISLIDSQALEET